MTKGDKSTIEWLIEIAVQSGSLGDSEEHFTEERTEALLAEFNELVNQHNRMAKMLLCILQEQEELENGDAEYISKIRHINPKVIETW
jgi:hypothetical protein